MRLPQDTIAIGLLLTDCSYCEQLKMTIIFYLILRNWKWWNWRQP